MDQNNYIQNQLPRLIPASQWHRYYPDPSPQALRWMIFTNKDGFEDHCVVRRGRRVLIDESRYHQWLNQQNKRIG